MAEMTDAELLTLFNEALQAVARGQSYQIGARMLTRANLREIRETIEWLDRRIAASTDATGGMGVITFEEQI